MKTSSSSTFNAISIPSTVPQVRFLATRVQMSPRKISLHHDVSKTQSAGRKAFKWAYTLSEARTRMSVV